MGDDLGADEDERTEELSAIEAIFPELIIDPVNRFSASLELAVTPARMLPVTFPSLTGGGAPPQQRAEAVRPQLAPETRYLSHLPPLKLVVTLPQKYPSCAPPEAKLVSQYSWIPEAKLEELQRRATILWEASGKSQVLYDYIDYVQQEAEDGFGLVPQGGSSLVLPQDIEVALLDYDLKMKRQKFEQETFDCGVCLEPKKGAVCHRLQLCRHVFCKECLQNFYNNCITEGDISQVKCLTPNCEKEVTISSELGNSRKRKRDRTLDPSELLEIPLDQDKVQRYVILKKKKKLESNKSTIYCPRKWCQGPARTGNSRNGDTQDSDEDDEAQNYDPNANQDEFPPPSERLAICEDCAFAFCLVCKISWHGEFQHCFPRRQYELTAEEKASEEYLKAHSTPCPTCNARCQKTLGCNHMICFQCRTHFCYLCSAWLLADNPYLHFNTKGQPCYQRLWELELGDGVGVERGAGGIPLVQLDPADLESDDEGEAEAAPLPPPAPNPPAQAGGRGEERWQAPPGIRVPRRVQQGLVRAAAPIQQNRDDGLQRFLRMAAEDIEDEWDSDDMGEDETLE